MSYQRLWVVQELEKRYQHGLPRLDPVEDMRITEPAISSAVQRIEQLEKQLSTNEVFKVRAWLRPFSRDWPSKQKITAFGVNLMRSQVLYWAPQKGDWLVVHGIPQWLPAYNYIPSKAKALPREGALGLVRPSLDAEAFSG